MAAKKGVDKKKVLPNTYSDEDWERFMDEFEEHVSSGGSTGIFWQRHDTPSWSHFYRRMRTDLDFAKRYRRALTFRAMLRIEEVETMTAQLMKGMTVVYDDEGKEAGLAKMDMVDVRRTEAAIKSHQWMAERENRAVFNPQYGDTGDPLESENKLSERMNASDSRLRALEKEKQRQKDEG
jgi:hypothetical protein